MSNIYIQEPPTKGKVSSKFNFVRFEIIGIDCVIKLSYF